MDYALYPTRDRNWIKRAPRVDVEHEAVVVHVDGHHYPVRILDISPGGLKLEGEETLRVGEYFGLRASRYGEFSVQIRWALGNQAGGVFLHPVVLPPSR